MRLVWNPVGERFFETGCDRGVLYPRLGSGVPWNGLISVNESPAGGDLEPLYIDGVKYMDVLSGEDFAASLEAFAAPPEFGPCDGVKAIAPGLFATQQPRETFGLSYRTLIGNDLEGIDHGYKLHLVYGCTAAPSAVNNQTVSDSPSPSTRQWDIHTVPQPADTYKPTAHFVIDSTRLDPFVLANLESYLYGRDDLDPVLPPQFEVIGILANVMTEPMTEPM